MNKKTETILIDDLGIGANAITDEQAHDIYNKLSEADKTSTDNLKTAEKETESSNYTSEDNSVIKPIENIPGVNVTPANLEESINESEKDIKEVLDEYDLDDESTIQMLKLIDEYKEGDKSSLYSRMPLKMQQMVNGILMTETGGGINPKQITSNRNRIAKMIIDSFINDAKISATVNKMNEELSATVDEMNEEYDKMLLDAINNTFNKIEEIRATDPEQANRIESIKNAFDRATEFEKQLEFAKNTSSKKFDKFLTRFKDDVYYFNKKVNNNNIGVTVNNIEEIVPIIKIALPQYTEDDIKKFVICICRTIEDTETLAGIAYEYRMIASIHRYKYMSIDEKGEIIFGNISKVIDAILS